MSSKPGRKFWKAGDCGHQHQSLEQAHNCATNQLRAHPRLQQIEVIRVSRRLSDNERITFHTQEHVSRKELEEVNDLIG